MTQIDRAADALDRFSEDEFDALSDAAALAFERAGARIEAALVKAAKTGELSFKDMAESILRDMARIAAQSLITRSIDTISGIAGGTLGDIAGGGQPNITINLSGVSDAASFTQSQGQIAAALSRSISAGYRFL